VNRRALLRRVAPLAVVGLAGCSGRSDDPGGGDETEPTEATEATTEPTTQATTTTTDGESTTETDGEATATTTTTAEPTTATAAAQSAVTVTVAPDGNLRFDPETFTLAAGGTVTWEWDSSGHNVRPSSQPADADWSGTAGGDGETYDAGHSYQHTFDTAGSYEYYCSPHQGFGMVASFTVE
jgi:plastocyanin